jgi:hypothetical protein
MTRQTDLKRAATEFFIGSSQTARGARLAVGASLMTVPAGAIISRPKRAYSTYKHSAAIFASVMQLVSVLPALGPNYKLGFRVGTMPEAKSIHQISPFIAATQVAPDYLAHTPFPVPEFGFAAVPNDSQRFRYEMDKSSTQSRGGEHTSRSGTPTAGTSTPGPSAQIKPSSSRNKPRGMISLANRRGPATLRERRPRSPKALPYRKGGCPPGYRYDRRKKMCIRTS